MNASPDEKALAPQSQATVPKELEIAALRRRLLGIYAADPTYDMVIRQDLRPLWINVKSLKSEISLFQPAVWDSLADLEESETRRALRERSPEAVLYVNRVLSVGPSMFGLVSPDHHSTPSWVAVHLHSDVTSRDVERLRRSGQMILEVPPSYEPPWPASFEIKVWPSVVRGELPGMWEGDAEGYDDEIIVDVMPALGYAFDEEHWERLEVEAVRVLQDGIQRIRRLTEDSQPDRRRPKSMARREIEIQQLYRWLMHHQTPVERSERQRLRRLCRLLGIAMPLHDKSSKKG